MTTLTVAIPTYNRREKLKRVLTAFEAEIAASGFAESVGVMVSDNASDDGTGDELARIGACWRAGSFHFSRRPDNVGAVRNLQWLYDACRTDYMWLFSDDDLPIPGAVAKIVRVLAENRPGVLMFSFIQPPGSKVRSLDFPDPVTDFSDAEEVARIVARGAKFSNFVFRKTDLPCEFVRFQEATLSSGRGGYYHCIVAISVFASGGARRLTVISEPLATCDDDYKVLRTPAADWGQIGWVFEHPFLKAEAPKLKREYENGGSYRSELHILWAWRCGVLELDPKYEEEYEQALRRLPFRPMWLESSPSAVLRAFVLVYLPKEVPRALHAAAAICRSVVKR